MANRIQVINPNINRGTVDRALRMGDFVWAPVRRNGSFPLRDMLNLRSVEALWRVHTGKN